MPSDLTSLIETRVRWAMHHYQLPPEHDWRNVSPACALWLMLNGEVQVATQGRKFQVVSGEAFLSDCRVRRDIIIPHQAEWLTVGLEAPLLGRDLLQNIGPPVHWIPKEHEREALRFYMSELVAYHPACGTAQLQVEGLARVLIGLVLNAHGIHNFGESQGGSPLWLADVLRLVRSNPGASVADLAREAHFSLAQFRRVFHEWAGMSPHEFLQRERLNHARRLLENTSLSVEAIARQTGFSGASPFTRAFRQFVGMTPAACRAGEREALKNQA
jgi:AraC-like DNA-binding protein